mgnify:CR=1 FL=1
MIEINYLCFLRRTDDFRLFEIRNLNINGIHYDFDFIEPISEFSLDYHKLNGENNRKKAENPPLGNKGDGEHISEDKPVADDHEKARDKVQSDRDNEPPKHTLPDGKPDHELEVEELNHKLDDINEVMLSKKPKTDEKPPSAECPPLENMEDVDTLLQAVPEVIKYTNESLKEKDFYYYFILGENVLVVAVTGDFNKELRGYLVRFLRSFQKIYKPEQILIKNESLRTPKLMLEFARIFVDALLSNYVIPYICSSFSDQFENSTQIADAIHSKLSAISGYIREFDNEASDGQIMSIFQKLDGLTSISAIAESLGLSLNTLKIILLYLDVQGAVDFRGPFYLWTVFERTHKANPYLFDGSDEQMSLINKFGGGKIISLLSRFDGRTTLKEIQKRMELKKLKLIKFVHALLKRNLIEPKGFYPKVEPINEEAVTILAMQGLEQKDIDLLNKISCKFDGTNELAETALDMNVSPNKIKLILDKIPQYVEMNFD